MDKIRHQENLVSIKGLTDSFRGRNLFRSIINPIVRLSYMIQVQAERPYWEQIVSSQDIFSIGPRVANTNIDPNGFYLSFDYLPDEQNDQFIKVAEEIWMSHQYPSMLFRINNEIVEPFRHKSAEEITRKIKGYFCHKSAEDDVMWIRKHNSLDFEYID